MRRLSPSTVLAGAALIVALGGVAQGAIPAADGKIRGCYGPADPAGGSVLKPLYVVDEQESCPANTTPLTWSQTGPQGAPGAQGAIGPPGPTGPGSDSAPVTKTGVYLTKVRHLQISQRINPREFGGGASAYCPKGEFLTGGAAWIALPLPNFDVISRPESNLGWHVTLRYLGQGQPPNLNVPAVFDILCAKMSIVQAPILPKRKRTH